MTSRKDIVLAASLDIEEEGLFKSCYPTGDYSLKNIRHLRRLEPLLVSGLRPTFFCSYSVLTDHESVKILDSLRRKYDIEIGAHLHHWNTPPFENGKRLSRVLRKVPTRNVNDVLLEKKLQTLLSAARDLTGGALTSFRMGRWDLHMQHFDMLCRNDIICDASIRPLHSGTTSDLAPDHFLFPTDPFWLQSGNYRILEVPLTVYGLVGVFPPFIKRIEKFLPRPVFQQLKASFKNWGALSLLPVQHPLEVMKFVTRRHIANGGKVISLTWHSSEMMPGGAPHMPDEPSVRKLMNKLRAYINWLHDTWKVRHVNMSELAENGSYNHSFTDYHVACDLKPS